MTPAGSPSPDALLERARREVAAGRPWKARDRLYGRLAAGADRQVLELLGEVLFAMGDHPAAGAVWFPVGREGADGELAAAAWRERHGDDVRALWRSLPTAVRQDVDHPRVREMHDRVLAAHLADHGPPRPLPPPDVVVPRQPPSVAEGLVLTLVGATAALLLGLGAWTALRWVLGALTG